MELSTSDDQDLEADVSVYSKVTITGEDGKCSVSNLESPAVNIKTTSGDIELNSMKIANSVLGEAILLQSESGNIRYGSHIRYLICLHLFKKRIFLIRISEPKLSLKLNL